MVILIPRKTIVVANQSGTGAGVPITGHYVSLH